MLWENMSGVVESMSFEKDPWVRNTRLVSRWKEIKRSVEEHKWYESEKAGHDIGWNRAFTDWLIRGSSEKKEEDRQDPE